MRGEAAAPGTGRVSSVHREEMALGARVVLAPGLAFRPERTPQPPGDHGARRPQDGWSDTRDSALAPTLAALPATGPTTLLTARRSTPRRNPATPRRLARARSASLPCHWPQGPSITEAGGRAHAPSAALATRRPQRAPRRTGRLLRGAGAGRGAGWGHGECCRTPVCFPT